MCIIPRSLIYFWWSLNNIHSPHNILIFILSVQSLSISSQWELFFNVFAKACVEACYALNVTPLYLNKHWVWKTEYYLRSAFFFHSISKAKPALAKTLYTLDLWANVSTSTDVLKKFISYMIPAHLSKRIHYTPDTPLNNSIRI